MGEGASFFQPLLDIYRYIVVDCCFGFRGLDFLVVGVDFHGFPWISMFFVVVVILVLEIIVVATTQQ